MTETGQLKILFQSAHGVATCNTRKSAEVDAGFKVPGLLVMYATITCCRMSMEDW